MLECSGVPLRSPTLRVFMYFDGRPQGHAPTNGNAKKATYSLSHSLFIKLNPMKKYFLFLSFLLVPFLFIQAQLNLFVGAGGSYYLGDLKNTALPGLATTHFSYKLGLGYDWQNRWGVRLQYSDGKISGSDAYATGRGRQLRGISFTSDFKEVSVLAKFRLNNVSRNSNLNFYLLGGVSGYQFAPALDYSNIRLPLVPEASFATKQIGIPVGVGVQYWFSKYVGVAAESMYHYTFTDYLDGVSKNGNDKFKDAVVDAHVSLLFRFSAKKSGGAKECSYSCPSFR